MHHVAHTMHLVKLQHLQLLITNLRQFTLEPYLQKLVQAVVKQPHLITKMMISSYSPLLQILPTHTQQQRHIHMVSPVIFTGKFRALLHKIQIGPIQHYIILITLQKYKQIVILQLLEFMQ